MQPTVDVTITLMYFATIYYEMDGIFLLTNYKTLEAKYYPLKSLVESHLRFVDNLVS